MKHYYLKAIIGDYADFVVYLHANNASGVQTSVWMVPGTWQD